MEQTLLPDRASRLFHTKYYQRNALTSDSFRVIDMSAKINDKEINNANSRSESENWDQTNREISQATFHMRGNRSRRQDGREFKSPSAAGMAITGHPCDGWVFWSVQTSEEASTSEIQPETEPEQIEKAAPSLDAATCTESAPAPESTQVNFFKMEWQKAVPKGQTRWHCNICNKHFLAPSDKMPETCPQGHKAS
jgi:hypothetical protein